MKHSFRKTPDRLQTNIGPHIHKWKLALACDHQVSGDVSFLGLPKLTLEVFHQAPSHARVFLNRASAPPPRGLHNGIVKLVIKIVTKCHPSFCFHSVALVKNYNPKPHVDMGDFGPSCCFTLGIFEGGKLAAEG